MSNVSPALIRSQRSWWNVENRRDTNELHKTLGRGGTFPAEVAGWPQMLGDTGAATLRPPILQTHGCERGHCVWTCVCGQGWRGKKKKKTGGGILVSHTELPQGPLGNYREVAKPHQILGSYSLLKCRSCSLLLPLVSLCVQINDCLHRPACIWHKKGSARVFSVLITAFWNSWDSNSAVKPESVITAKQKKKKRSWISSIVGTLNLNLLKCLHIYFKLYAVSRHGLSWYKPIVHSFRSIFLSLSF